MNHSERREIIVIGGGIIGVTSALALQAEGFSVQLIERRDIAAEASGGNAGGFAYSDIEPLATPGVIRKAPKWLLDPLGPLSIPPIYVPTIIPWLFRFWRASKPDCYAAAVKAQAQLMELSLAATERLIALFHGEPLMRREGQLQLYEGEDQFVASLPGWELRRKYGVEFELLTNRHAIAEIQPGLSNRFTHAGFTPKWMNAVNPETWTKHLATQFLNRGGIIKHTEVMALKLIENGVEIRTVSGTLHAEQVLVCAGAWSHILARTLGDTIPLDTERGYNTTFPFATFDLKTHLTFPGHGFVVTRIDKGLRVGGAVELGGLKRPPNFRRADILVKKAAEFLPGLQTTHGTRWMGFRPSLPDSLPVICHSPKSKSVIYAFGHGHLGLTQSAGTAELVAALASARDTAISLSPFSAGRF